ncbi:MAG TPA: VanW family protein, partial [Clostridia bacterium]|nr:VanW family protein [Clostridia bacterium]
LGFMGIWAQAQVQQYSYFKHMRNIVNRQTFYPGILVDGVSLEGMSLDQALERLDQRDREQDDAFEIYLTAGDVRWRISSAEVPIQRNTEAVLRHAYAIGRNGTLEERYQQITRLALNPISLETSMLYDREAVRKLTDIVAQRLTVEARAAAVKSFDFDTRVFTYTDESAGQRVDADALYQQAIAVLDARRYGTNIPVQVLPVEPAITRAQIEGSYGRIAGFATETTSNKNRNMNIDLSTQAVNRTVIAPGETFSFNQATGQRTPDKGYREAGAIQNGILIQEVGGGVCQTSSTLFNALIRSGLDIVVRQPHAWPSDYVSRGEDAMVDWPAKDLKMINNTGGPIYIIGWYENRKLTFEVYGKKLGDGVTMELESKTIGVYKPGAAVYTQNPSLAPGTEKIIRQARTGYAVDTYLVAYKNGVETGRKYLYRSDYRMYNLEIEYN